MHTTLLHNLRLVECRVVEPRICRANGKFICRLFLSVVSLTLTLFKGPLYLHTYTYMFDHTSVYSDLFIVVIEIFSKFFF